MASIRGGPREILEDTDSGRIAASDDPEAFATAILELAASPGLRREMSRRAIASANRFRWEDLIDQLWREPAKATMTISAQRARAVAE